MTDQLTHNIDHLLMIRISVRLLLTWSHNLQILSVKRQQGTTRCVAMVDKWNLLLPQCHVIRSSRDIPGAAGVDGPSLN